MGNGRRVECLKNRWCDNELLCVSFPSLYTLARFKEAWVVDFWNQSNDSSCWTPSFSRHLTIRRLRLILWSVFY